MAVAPPQLSGVALPMQLFAKALVVAILTFETEVEAALPPGPVHSGPAVGVAAVISELPLEYFFPFLER